MPDFSTGMTQEFRAFRAAKQVSLGKGLDGFVASALPDVAHLGVLTYLVHNSKEQHAAAGIAEAVGEPKGAVQDALERFEKLGLVRRASGMLARKYGFAREALSAELAVRLIKLWEHPQTHETVLRAVLARQEGGPGAAGRR